MIRDICRILKIDICDQQSAATHVADHHELEASS